MENILKQSSWLFTAQALGKAIGFFYAIFLAKNLSVPDFGLYSTALAYFSMISVVSDLGFNRYLITEIARDRLKITQLLLTVGVFRLLLSTVFFAIFSVALYLLDPDKLRVNLILLAALATIPQTIAFTLDAIFIAIQRLKVSSIGLIVLNLSTTLIGILLVKDFGATGAVVALIIGQLIYLFALTIFLLTQKLKLSINIEWTTLKQVLKGSLPYGIVGILGLLYFKIDTLMLAYLKGNFEVGIYGIAYKFLEAVVFIPAVLSTALFPSIVKIIDNNPKNAYKLYLKVTVLLFSISILVVVSYLFLLPMIINNFLPQYSPAIEVIRILSLTIPFMFMISPQGVILFSQKRFLKALLLMSVFNLSLNIALNLYLIPRYSFYGAAWATLISDIVGFSLFFVYISLKLAPRK